ncbi:MULTISPECIES: hypothetical protein [Streptomyces]|uniref:hypothetical protein n=1 Tax=Streptomyces TaxID=1883 RepID=UPI0006EBC8D9|nr:MULTISPECIES: hypothetical protein [Streptomyces]MCP3766110.1 hypothetical protein [Streptomyces sp. MAR25Y5]OBQ47642.1 hypothetical protein A4U61_20340 [Streptomyces sp. H-KF8]
MADTQQSDPKAGQTSEQTSEQRAAQKAGRKADRKAAKLAKRISGFAAAHGGAEGQIAYLGQRGARIVLVGEDGGWGDLVAHSYPIAQKAAERAGLTLHDDFDGEFAAKVRTGRYEWTRMAGIQVGGPANG